MRQDLLQGNRDRKERGFENVPPGDRERKGVQVLPPVSILLAPLLVKKKKQENRTVQHAKIEGCPGKYGRLKGTIRELEVRVIVEEENEGTAGEIGEGGEKERSTPIEEILKEKAERYEIRGEGL